MTKSLLFVAAALTAAGAMAQPSAKRVNLADQPVKEAHVVIPAKAKSQRIGKGGALKILNNNRIKTIFDAKIVNKSINPAVKRAPARTLAADASAATLYESFEGYANAGDDNHLWLPDGWTRKSANPDREYYEQWSVNASDGMMLPPATDGQYMIGVSFSTDPQDEWLITPVVAVKEFDQLTFTYNLDPFWFYNPEKVDFDTYEWIEQEQIATLQILGKEEGAEEWTVLRDFAQEFMGESPYDLLMYTSGKLDPQTVNISAFKGKNAQFAFRYVAVDANSIMIDEIKIAAPELEVSYMMPLNTLYFGANNTASIGYLGLGVAMYPVYEPIIWENTTYNYDATYSWDYCDPDTSDWTTSDEQDFLSVIYHPDFTSEFTTRNNMYYLPKLHGSMPGASEGEYTVEQAYLQAGGAADFKYNDGTMDHFGLLPFDINTDGMVIATADAESVGGQYGDPDTPICGYDKNTINFWNQYTFRDEMEPGYACELKAFLNYIYPSENPLVVNGLWVSGKGQVGPDALFKAEIIGLNEEYVQDKIVATATCKGSDFNMTEGGIQNFYSIPFTFETPVELCSSEYIAYIVKISGFNDPENVTYFAPYQSYVPNKDYLAFGWVEKDITMDGQTRTSLSPLAYFDLGLGDAYNSFAINLDAYYPYLTSEVESVVCPRGESVNIPLVSYHHGDNIKVEIEGCDHEGISASVTGQHDKAALSITDNCTCQSEHSYNVVVSAPGVKKTFAVSSLAGIADIVTDANESPVTGVYNLAGQSIANAGNLPAGVYIVRRADGTAQLLRK